MALLRRFRSSSMGDASSKKHFHLPHLPSSAPHPSDMRADAPADTTDASWSQAPKASDTLEEGNSVHALHQTPLSEPTVPTSIRTSSSTTTTIATTGANADAPATSTTTASTTSTPTTSMKAKKSVRWSDIHVREYARIVGDNPSCSSGPPIGLGWEYLPSRVFCIESYERTRGLRKSQLEMVLTREEREKLLVDEWGISWAEVVDAIRANIKAKNQRRRTVNNLGKADRLEEMIESVARKLKRTLLLEKRSGASSTSLASNTRKGWEFHHHKSASGTLFSSAASTVTSLETFSEYDVYDSAGMSLDLNGGNGADDDGMEDFSASDLTSSDESLENGNNFERALSSSSSSSHHAPPYTLTSFQPRLSSSSMEFPMTVCPIPGHSNNNNNDNIIGSVADDRVSYGSYSIHDATSNSRAMEHFRNGMYPTHSSWQQMHQPQPSYHHHHHHSGLFHSNSPGDPRHACPVVISEEDDDDENDNNVGTIPNTFDFVPQSSSRHHYHHNPAAMSRTSDFNMAPPPRSTSFIQSWS